MRLLACLFFVVACTLTGVAELRPLSSKEASLMLRSGCSSDTVLREIQQRRVVDAPDPATKKSLLEFGASPQLLSALESGQYRTDAAEAERAKQEAAAASARREAQVEQTHRDATKVLQEQKARAAATTGPTLGTTLTGALKDKLVRCRDGTISPVDANALESKKLIAFYFSAHWCAPCRKFTPQLVDYYNRVAASHPEFELIFVSYDKSRFNWETYMRDTKMPWLAIDFDHLADFPQLKQLGGDGIPSLLVLDEQSRLVASSYDGEKYLGPQHALAALDKIFAGASVAQTR